MMQQVPRPLTIRLDGFEPSWELKECGGGEGRRVNVVVERGGG